MKAEPSRQIPYKLAIKLELVLLLLLKLCGFTYHSLPHWANALRIHKHGFISWKEQCSPNTGCAHRARYTNWTERAPTIALNLSTALKTWLADNSIHQARRGTWPQQFDEVKSFSARCFSEFTRSLQLLLRRFLLLARDATRRQPVWMFALKAATGLLYGEDIARNFPSARKHISATPILHFLLLRNLP